VSNRADYRRLQTEVHDDDRPEIMALVAKLRGIRRAREAFAALSLEHRVLVDVLLEKEESSKAVEASLSDDEHAVMVDLLEYDLQSKEK